MILRLWRFIWGGCDHHWQILTSINLHTDPGGQGLPHGKKYHLQCTKCGIVKAKTL